MRLAVLLMLPVASTSVRKICIHSTSGLVGVVILLLLVLLAFEHLAKMDVSQRSTTLLPGGVSDAVWDAAARHHDEATLAQVVAMIVAINAWNRIAVSTATTPAG